MVEAMRHGDLEMISNPEALQYMCLSILHYMLHIFKHIWNIGYRQGFLITDGKNRSKWTKSLVVVAKTLEMVKMSKQMTSASVTELYIVGFFASVLIICCIT